MMPATFDPLAINARGGYLAHNPFQGVVRSTHHLSPYSLCPWELKPEVCTIWTNLRAVLPATPFKGGAWQPTQDRTQKSQIIWVTADVAAPDEASLVERKPDRQTERTTYIKKATEEGKTGRTKERKQERNNEPKKGGREDRKKEQRQQSN